MLQHFEVARGANARRRLEECALGQLILQLPRQVSRMLGSVFGRYASQTLLGFFKQGSEMQVWLDENCGADGWAMTPAGLGGVINDAVAIYFLNATGVAAFVTRWCLGSAVEISDGAFRVREDQPARRIVAAPHKTAF